MNKANFGTVTFDGREYFLTTGADFTNRLLPFSNNYNDVCDGEWYAFEMAADAVDQKGIEYKVFWIFSNIKGENARELDSYDYDVADFVSTM